MKLYAAIFLFCLCPQWLQAQSATSKPQWRYSQAAEQYKAEQYDSAAVLYQSLIDDGTEAFELYYNAGNAYYKAGELGKAILYYEKARKLNPHHPDVLYNLELAYLKQPDREPESIPLHVFERMWHAVTGLMKSGEWAWLAIGFWWVALIAIALFWLVSITSIRKFGFYLSGSAFLVGALALILAFGKYRIEKRDHFAIIMTPSAVIKSAPSHESTDLYILREGFKLQVTDKAGDWTKVMLTDGNTGWLEAEDLAEI